jgi:predicted membrane protein
MKKFLISIGTVIFIVAGSITLSNYIEHRNKYRETTPQERAEFDSTQKKFIKDHRTVQAKVKGDTFEMVK